MNHLETNEGQMPKPSRRRRLIKLGCALGALAIGSFLVMGIVEKVQEASDRTT
jgi:hypothetical protein